MKPVLCSVICLLLIGVVEATYSIISFTSVATLSGCNANMQESIVYDYETGINNQGSRYIDTEDDTNDFTILSMNVSTPTAGINITNVQFMSGFTASLTWNFNDMTPVTVTWIINYTAVSSVKQVQNTNVNGVAINSQNNAIFNWESIGASYTTLPDSIQMTVVYPSSITSTQANSVQFSPAPATAGTTQVSFGLNSDVSSISNRYIVWFPFPNVNLCQLEEEGIILLTSSEVASIANGVLAGIIIAVICGFLLCCVLPIVLIILCCCGVIGGAAALANTR